MKGEQFSTPQSVGGSYLRLLGDGLLSFLMAF